MLEINCTIDYILVITTNTLLNATKKIKLTNQKKTSTMRTKPYKMPKKVGKRLWMIGIKKYKQIKSIHNNSY